MYIFQGLPLLNGFYKAFYRLAHTYICQVYKVETAGDCYIVAGALMRMDEDGFNSVDIDPDPRRGVGAVMAFSKVRHQCQQESRLFQCVAISLIPTILLS